MQAEKQFLIDEVGSYLDKSDYVFLADFTSLSVADVEDLRTVLSGLGAEFHVVKNNLLKLAANARDLTGLDHLLQGPTALVVGGKDAAAVAKVLEKFIKDKKKMSIKGGALDKKALTPDDFSSLAKLPAAEILKAQLLGLLNTPATQMVRVIQGVPQALVYVLQAKADKEGAGAA